MATYIDMDDWPLEFLDKLDLAVEAMCKRPDQMDEICKSDFEFRKSHRNFVDEYHFRFADSSLWSIMKLTGGHFTLFFYPNTTAKSSADIASGYRPNKTEMFESQIGPSDDLRDLCRELYFVVRTKSTGLLDSLNSITDGKTIPPPTLEQTDENSAVTSIVDTMMAQEQNS